MEAEKPTTDATATTRRIAVARDALGEEIATLAAGARRSLSVFSPELDAGLFNTQRLAHLLAGFAARHRHNRARFLVEDGEQAVRDNVRLVELCRRMSEFVEMRRVAEEHAGRHELFLIVDDESFLHQQDLSHPEAILVTHQRGRTSELLTRFRQMWDRSEPISAIRTTGL